MKTYNKEEIKKHIEQHLINWKFEENALKREFKFKTFIEAFSFMTAIALDAEKLDHHPDWNNSYNKVEVSLSTHSAKGITQLDFDLADKMESLFKKISN